MKNAIKLSILSCALLSQLQASEITLKTLQVTSTAIKTDELKSTDVVEVYTQEDIEKAHVRNLYEFLNQETSVYSTSGYGNPFLQKIDMRGFGVGDGYQNIVVTINGRKMNNVDMVPQLLSSISPSSIKKIEIIKSSGIVIGGDGANAGVINITTKKDNSKEVSYYMGNYGLVGGSFYLGHSDEKFSINASGEDQKSNGIRTIDTAGNKDENSFRTGAFNLAYTPIEELELRLGAALTKTDVNYAGTMTKAEYEDDPTQQGTSYGSASAYANQKFDSKVISGGFTYTLNDDLSLEGKISSEAKESKFEQPAYSSTGVSNYDYTSFQSYLDYTTDIMALKIGLDGFYAKLDYANSYNVNLNMIKDNQAAFVMSEFYLQHMTIKAGYRYETMKFSESSGDNETEELHGVELGVNYMLNKQSSLYFNYSHGYATASLDRMFSYTNPTTGYMGYVEPSQSDNYNIGYNNITATNKLKVTAYYIDMTNEIYYYADPSYQNSKNTNIEKSHKYGLDFYDKYILSQSLNFVFNYNYVQAIIDEEVENGESFSGNTLPGVSDHNIKATISYLPIQSTTIALTQVYRSEAYAANDFGNSFTQKQDPFYSTDISATYVKDNWEVFAKINNLFDQKNGLWTKDDAIYPINFTTTALAGFKLKY